MRVKRQCGSRKPTIPGGLWDNISKHWPFLIFFLQQKTHWFLILALGCIEKTIWWNMMKYSLRNFTSPSVTDRQSSWGMLWENGSTALDEGPASTVLSHHWFIIRPQRRSRWSSMNWSFSWYKVITRISHLRASSSPNRASRCNSQQAWVHSQNLTRGKHGKNKRYWSWTPFGMIHRIPLGVLMVSATFALMVPCQPPARDEHPCCSFHPATATRWSCTHQCHAVVP